MYQHRHGCLLCVRVVLKLVFFGSLPKTHGWATGPCPHVRAEKIFYNISLQPCKVKFNIDISAGRPIRGLVLQVRRWSIGESDALRLRQGVGEAKMNRVQ